MKWTATKNEYDLKMVGFAKNDENKLMVGCHGHNLLNIDASTMHLFWKFLIKL